MWFWIIVIAALAILAILGLAAAKPNTFSVVRETSISAPPHRVHALINNFHAWGKWSPWDKLDPAMRRAHSGPQTGVGSIYEWQGNKKVGQGRMEILGSTPERIDVDLQFMAPWKAHNQTVFTLTPESGDTKVRWEMTGASPFMIKVMGLFMSMDKMVGKDFEKGLAAMKTAAESG
jgi:Polyketide cyclase / dehydrase and lipid transport